MNNTTVTGYTSAGVTPYIHSNPHVAALQHAAGTDPMKIAAYRLGVGLRPAVAKVAQVCGWVKSFYSAPAPAEKIESGIKERHTLDQLKAWVSRLEISCAKLRTNAREIEKIKELVSEHPEFVKELEEAQLRKERDKLFKTLAERISTLKPHLQEKVTTELPLVSKYIATPKKPLEKTPPLPQGKVKVVDGGHTELKKKREVQQPPERPIPNPVNLKAIEGVAKPKQAQERVDAPQVRRPLTDEAAKVKIDQGDSPLRKEKEKRVVQQATCSKPPDLANLKPPDGVAMAGPAGGNYGSPAFITIINDINGDKIPDWALGFPYASPGNILFAGQVAVLYGGQDFSKIDLQNLLPTQGFLVNGLVAYDWLGGCVIVLEDFNGDGFRDLGICASSALWSPTTYSGKFYVLFGPFMPPINLGNLSGSQSGGTRGFVINGQFNSLLASCAAGGVDLTGDGLPELLVAAPGATTTITPPYDPIDGQFYGFEGHPDPWPPEVNLTSAAFVGNGKVGDQLGCDMAMSSNIDGKGSPGFAVVAPGATYPGLSYTGIVNVWYVPNGTALPATLSFTFDGVNGFQAYAAPGDLMGGYENVLKIVNNFTKSGIPTIFLGLPRATVNALSAAGKLYIFNPPTSSQLNLSAQSSGSGMEIDGDKTNGYWPTSLAFIDTNSDGDLDLVGGVPGLYDTDAGEVVEAYGIPTGLPPNLTLAALNNTAQGLTLSGIIPRANLGSSVADLTGILNSSTPVLGIVAPNVGNGTIYLIYFQNATPCPPSSSPTSAPSPSSTASTSIFSPSSPASVATSSPQSSPMATPSLSQPQGPASQSGTVNVMIIAIPIATIAVLVGMTLTAVFLLRRRKKLCFAEKRPVQRADGVFEDL